MASWLVKTEPSSYSLEDLERERTAVWDGVRNPVALRNLRAMQPGDRVLVYHSGGPKGPPAVVGLANVVKPAYPDPRATDPRWVVVELGFVKRLPRPVALSEIKATREFEASALVRQGRLSVVPLTDSQWEKVMELAGIERRQ